MHDNNLPNFLVVGAMKSGTTTMYELLQQHSRITMSNIKEVHFFDYDEKYQLGLPYYKRFFDVSPDTLAIGEVTPIYFLLPEIPKRIVEALGEQTKIIVLLRNPVDRIISHYKMMLMNKKTNDSLSESIKKNLVWMEKGRKPHRDFSYIERSLYYPQLKRYFHFFPPENIKVVLFEKEFIDQRRETMNEIFDFLSLPCEHISLDIHTMQSALPLNQKLNEILNTGHPINQLGKRLIPTKKFRNKIKIMLNRLNSNQVRIGDNIEEIRDWLNRDIFNADIKKTEKLLSVDLSDWIS